MVSTRKNKHQDKKFLSKLDESSKDFVIGSYVKLRAEL